jgi:hypothetical protein
MIPSFWPCVPDDPVVARRSGLARRMIPRSPRRSALECHGAQGRCDPAAHEARIFRPCGPRARLSGPWGTQGQLFLGLCATGSCRSGPPCHGCCRFGFVCHEVVSFWPYIPRTSATDLALWHTLPEYSGLVTHTRTSSGLAAPRHAFAWSCGTQTRIRFGRVAPVIVPILASWPTWPEPWGAAREEEPSSGEFLMVCDGLSHRGAVGRRLCQACMGKRGNPRRGHPRLA